MNERKRWYPKGPRYPRCARCQVEFELGRLNSSGHCRHCADELNECHPEFSGAFHEDADGGTR